MRIFSRRIRSSLLLGELSSLAVIAAIVPTQPRWCVRTAVIMVLMKKFVSFVSADESKEQRSLMKVLATFARLRSVSVLLLSVNHTGLLRRGAVNRSPSHCWVECHAPSIIWRNSFHRMYAFSTAMRTRHRIDSNTVMCSEQNVSVSCSITSFSLMHTATPRRCFLLGAFA
uniref:Putative secreted protein n=1 Tax=Anopheles triannulatus TaxID=58253 RepID=A0A2M4B4P6_9DIPT